MNYRMYIAALAGVAFLGLSACNSGDLTGVSSDTPEGLAATVDIDNFDSVLGANDSVDLIGGKNTKVGTVSIVEVDGGYDVTYNTLAGYCITEWHLDVGRYNAEEGEFTGIPLNRAGNPRNGRFEYSGEGGCETTVSQFVPDSAVEGDESDGGVVFAAHAVVTDDPTFDGEDCGYIYGIASDGNIYKINLGDFSETLVYETGLETDAVAETWPNSLAYDVANNRLYYSNATAFGAPTGDGVPDETAPLYYYDLLAGTETFSGYLSRHSASGTFAGGELWYVPQNLDDNLRRITFNGDGTIANPDGDGPLYGDELICPDFTGDTDQTRMRFGDVVFNPIDGLVYGSARIGDDARGPGTATFFSVNPTTCEYDEIGTGLELSQLTFACDGRLIGFDTSAKEYLLIDPTDGSQEVIGTSSLAINDLAPGRCDCEPVGEFDETAWGAGPSFPGNNWAMYIPFN